MDGYVRTHIQVAYDELRLLVDNLSTLLAFLLVLFVAHCKLLVAGRVGLFTIYPQSY